MGKLATLLRNPLAARLYWAVWGMFVLLLLVQLTRNGHYVPVSTKPGLCLDTRTGQLHFAHVASGFLDEVATWSDDKRQVEIQRTVTR